MRFHIGRLGRVTHISVYESETKQRPVLLEYGIPCYDDTKEIRKVVVWCNTHSLVNDLHKNFVCNNIFGVCTNLIIYQSTETKFFQ